LKLNPEPVEGMGCASSVPGGDDAALFSHPGHAANAAANFKVARPKKTMLETAAAALSPLDNRVQEVLRKGDIRLVRSAWFVSQPEGYQFQRRRELEDLEKAGALPSPLLSADEAVALVCKCDRSAAAVSYGWLSADHPYPCGERVREMHAALSTLSHIEGFFWDFASLMQKPRTSEEDEAFGRALAAMNDLYSSPCGLSVLQLRRVPPRPVSFEGLYNERAYEERGWCVFEDAVVASLLSRVRCFPKIQEALETLPPKLFVQQDDGRLMAGTLSADVDLETFASRLHAAKFTGKGDEEVVLQLFKTEYVERYAMQLEGVLQRGAMTSVWWAQGAAGMGEVP